jgi:hypothetical protein
VTKEKLIKLLEDLPEDIEILIFSPLSGSLREPRTDVDPNLAYRQRPLVLL